MLQAYRVERDRLKDEVEVLKARIKELEKIVVGKSEQVKALDEEAKRLNKNVEHDEERL